MALENLILEEVSRMIKSDKNVEKILICLIADEIISSQLFFSLQ